MAYDESRDRADDQGESDPEGQDASAPVAIATTDPVIDSIVEHQSEWKTHPDTTISVETSQVVEPNPLYVAGVRTVVLESHPQHEEGRSGGQGHRDSGRGPSQDHGHDDERKKQADPEHPQKSVMKSIQQPSMMKTLMITAGIALLGGMIGAMGYTYFFGPKPGKSSSDRPQSKSDSGASGDSGSKSDSGSSGDSSSRGDSGASDDSSGGKGKGSHKAKNSQVKNNAVASHGLQGMQPPSSTLGLA